MTKPAPISSSELRIFGVVWDRPGCAATKRDGRRFLYTATLSRERYAKRATRSLASRLFGGRAAPLVAHLAEGAPLSDEDLDELEALVARMRRERDT